MWNPLKAGMPYSKEDIAAHQVVIEKLKKDKRDLIALLRDNAGDADLLNTQSTITIVTSNIHTAQLSLNFMLERNRKFMEGSK